jgi:protein SCO1/2
MLRKLNLTLLFALALATVPLSVFAGEADHEHHHDHAAAGEDDPHAHHREMMSKPAEAAKPADVELKDRELLTQDGEPVKFVTDVIGDRVVVIDFVYTTCTTVCPVLTAVFSQLQDKLGDRLGEEVFLVSMTVDATRDTPPRLKAYAAKHNAREGWIWLTGDEIVVDDVLDGMGAYTPNFENHPAMVLVGDGKTGEWSRFFGFPSADRIMTRVDELLAARQ